MSDRINKARFWWGVLYPENMIDNWQDNIGDILQLPYSYCLHNLDIDNLSEHRKDHIHLIIVFNNTTTYKHALEVLKLLSKDDCNCINTCKAVINIRQAYEYLIHNTDDCKKKNKFLYPVESRIIGNNFDIGAYEQLSINDKNAIVRILCDCILENQITNFIDFYAFVISNFDDTNYFEMLKTYSGLFERLIKGNFHKYENLKN